MLADCEAKRRIMELLTGHAATETLDAYTDADFALVETLRALAQPYADHEDYREAWRP